MSQDPICAFEVERSTDVGGELLGTRQETHPANLACGWGPCSIGESGANRDARPTAASQASTVL